MNIVYVADDAKPVDAAVAGAAVARVSGLLMLTPGADAGVAEERLSSLGLTAAVDKIVVARSSTSDSVPWAVL
ncbi:MAG: hypothetical protein ACRD2W_07305 [Acidimicrobiales bacterium]